jgi:hypothetical protein
MAQYASKGETWSRDCVVPGSSPATPQREVRNMSHARPVFLMLLLLLPVFGAVTSASGEENVNVVLGWAPSPPQDGDGHPLAPAVRYRLYATRDGGPVTYMCETPGDTVCTVALLRGSAYRIRVVGFDAQLRASAPSPFSETIYYEPAGDLTDVDDLPARGAAIESTYPNPFNPLVRVRYAVSTQDDGTKIALDILDIRGHLVLSLESGPQAAGHHEAAWGGTDATGRRMPSGAYFVRLRSASGQQIRPITMVK